MRTRSLLILVCSLLLASCTTGGESSEICVPNEFAPNPNLGGEARLTQASPASFEAWSLWFATFAAPAGSPIIVPVSTEVKVVWSVTGEGDFSVSVQNESGATTEPTFGPDPNGGSNWEVPGDEWGTGWEFAEAGCWEFTVTRGEGMASLTVLVES